MQYPYQSTYPSHRTPVLARAVVATSQPLAAQAGLAMLARGGNAVDAALATAITLTVVEPVSNGIGSDAFAIIWDGARLHGLNASGAAPAAWSPDYFKDHTAMPERGWDSVTVPGAVSAWAALSEKFGKLPFADLFEPAIRYARDGFHVTPYIAWQWEQGARLLGGDAAFAAAFLPGGRAPRAGELFHHPEQAATLEAIAGSHGEAFYRGALAEAIAAHARACGGALCEADLAAHQPVWVDTISAPYGDLRIHEIPPNGQGLAALLALGILAEAGLHQYPVDSPDSLHLQIEAMKLAFADAHRYIADPRVAAVPVADLLDPAYLRTRAAMIDMTHASEPTFGTPRGGTVYLTAADANGMMVSMIQSNYMGFGSGVVVPGTGIHLQNRGCGFTLQPDHPNQVAGGKRPYHTIIPGFAMRGDTPCMGFGVMGGPVQPQGHVQVVTRLCDYGQSPQTILDAPRWRVLSGRKVAIEHGTNPATIDALTARGHAITLHGGDAFGGGQIAYRQGDGSYIAASDPRKDGQAVGM